MSNQLQEFELLRRSLNQKQRRLFAWAKAISLWKWWIESVANAIEMSVNTVRRGKKELETNDPIIFSNKIRNKWWWRKKTVDLNPEIYKEIENIMEENTIWDPMSCLKWTSKSLRKMQEELKNKGICIWYDVVSRILKWMWYSLQLNKKMIEWWNHKDRDEQFKFIWDKTKKGLDIICKLDLNIYEKWIKVSNEQFEKINLKKEDFHWEWNYTIWPNNS